MKKPINFKMFNFLSSKFTNFSTSALQHSRTSPPFTLVEILMAIVIMALLMTAAMTAFTEMMKGQGVSASARNLGQILKLARSHAINNREYVAVLIPKTPGTPTDIPTNYYDPNGDGTLVEIPDNFFTSVRVIIAPEFGTNGIIFVQYGQFLYDTLKCAVDSFESENYIYATEIGVLPTKCIICYKKGTTDLSNPLEAKNTCLGIFEQR